VDGWSKALIVLYRHTEQLMNRTGSHSSVWATHGSVWGKPQYSTSSYR